MARTGVETSVERTAARGFLGRPADDRSPECPSGGTIAEVQTWDDVVRLASGLPGVEISTSYRTPAAKVGGRTFLRLRTEAEGWLVVMCELDEKEAMLASGSPAFHTTPHYDGYGAILVDLDVIDGGELGELIEQAWRRKAPATLRRQLDD